MEDGCKDSFGETGFGSVFSSVFEPEPLSEIKPGFQHPGHLDICF